MTIVEAASFGVPSIVHHSDIGACELLQPVREGGGMGEKQELGQPRPIGSINSGPEEVAASKSGGNDARASRNENFGGPQKARPRACSYVAAGHMEGGAGRAVCAGGNGCFFADMGCPASLAQSMNQLLLDDSRLRSVWLALPGPFCFSRHPQSCRVVAMLARVLLADCAMMAG